MAVVGDRDLQRAVAFDHVDSGRGSRRRGARRWSATPARGGRASLSSSGVWRVGCSPRSHARSSGPSTSHPLRAAARSARLSIAAPAPVLVQRGRAQLDDQRAQAGDLLGQVLDGGLRPPRAAPPRCRAGAAESTDAQAGEALQRLVVQLARPAPALLLGGLDALAQPLLLDRLAGRHGGRRAGRERAAAAARPRGRSRASSPRWSKAASTPTARPRNASGTSSAVVGLEAEQPLRDVQRRAGVDEPLGACVAAPGPVTVPSIGIRLPPAPAGDLAGAGGDHERARPRSSRITSVRAPTSARAALDDQLEDAARGSSPRRGPARSPPPRRARARLARGHRGGARPPCTAARCSIAIAAQSARIDRRTPHQPRVERPAALLLRQVEVAPHLVADHHRDAQERLHLRVRSREAARARVLTEVLEPQRPRAPRSAARGCRDRGADPRSLRCVASSMPAVMKRSSVLPALVEHADGRVARTGDLARDIEQLPQDRLDVQRGDEEPASCIDQPT